MTYILLFYAFTEQKLSFGEDNNLKSLKFPEHSDPLFQKYLQYLCILDFKHSDLRSC